MNEGVSKGILESNERLSAKVSGTSEAASEPRTNHCAGLSTLQGMQMSSGQQLLLNEQCNIEAMQLAVGTSNDSSGSVDIIFGPIAPVAPQTSPRKLILDFLTSRKFEGRAKLNTSIKPLLIDVREKKDKSS